MSSPRVTYTWLPQTTQEAETDALATVYRFILDCRAKKNVEPTPEPDVRNTRGESEYGSRATRILSE